MITRLEVDGFKSLRDFAVDLEPMTVFIGPNSAGKSNILEALGLLSRVASQPLDEAFKHGRGRSLDQFTRTGGEPGRTMRFAVEMLLPRTRFKLDKIEDEIISSRYRYELVIERWARQSGAEQLVVGNESLSTIDRAEDRWIDAHPELADRASLSHGHVQLRYSDPPADRARKWTQTAIADLPNVRPPGTVGEELSSYRVVQLDAARLREPSERIDAGTLAPDASNLPTVLADLPKPLLGEIRADLVSLVPGISSFEVVPDGDSFRIDFELSGGERLPARLVSDGTLRILGLLTALKGNPRPSVIGIEEPENGIYPGRIRALLELLQETIAPKDEGELAESPAAAPGAEPDVPPLPTQLLLTTHSPVVLAAFRSKPQHLRFVDLVRRDGQLVTRARTVGRSAGPDRGRITISPREIDRLLQCDSAPFLSEQDNPVRCQARDDQRARLAVLPLLRRLEDAGRRQRP